jgi:tetratricopeptide (TPR) repeat protein
LETGRALSGEAHPLVATAYYNLGTLLVELGRYAEAGENLEAALEVDLQLYGEEHPDVARDLNSLAVVAYHRGDVTDAEAGFQRAMELYRRTLGEPHPDFRSALFSLVTLWFGQGRDSEARPLLEATLRAWRQQPPPEAWAPPQAAVMLGGSLLRSGRLAEAEPWLREGHAGLCTVLGAQNNLSRQALSSLIELYTASGRADQAERYRGFLEPDVTACPGGDPPPEG